MTIQGVVRHFDGAVGQDHRDLGGLGLAQHRLPAGFDHRRERDHVDLLRDEGADRLDLVLLLLLRVGELQRDAGFLRRVLIEVVFAVRHSLSAPIWLKPSTMDLGASPSAGVRFDAAGTGREQRAEAAARQHRLNEALHRSPLK